MSAHASDCAVCRKDLMACTCPKPPAAPELPEGWVWDSCLKAFCCSYAHCYRVTISGLQALLASRGFSIVNAKEQAAFACPACGRLYEDSAPELLPSTLEAHIAELEAKLETTIQRAQWDLEWRIEAEAAARKLDDRIAELERENAELEASIAAMAGSS